MTYVNGDSLNSAKYLSYPTFEIYAVLGFTTQDSDFAVNIHLISICINDKVHYQMRVK